MLILVRRSRSQSKFKTSGRKSDTKVDGAASRGVFSYVLFIIHHGPLTCEIKYGDDGITIVMFEFNRLSKVDIRRVSKTISTTL